MTRYLSEEEPIGKPTITPEEASRVLKTKQLEVEIEVKKFDGYKPAFKGAMQAYGILAIKSARWLQHVTGTGGESVEHYWKNDCETCKEIAEFISEWIDAAEQSVNPTETTSGQN